MLRVVGLGAQVELEVAGRSRSKGMEGVRGEHDVWLRDVSMGG